MNPPPFLTAQLAQGTLHLQKPFPTCSPWGGLSTGVCGLQRPGQGGPAGPVISQDHGALELTGTLSIDGQTKAQKEVEKSWAELELQLPASCGLSLLCKAFRALHTPSASACSPPSRQKGEVGPAIIPTQGPRGPRSPLTQPTPDETILLLPQLPTVHVAHSASDGPA